MTILGHSGKKIDLGKLYFDSRCMTQILVSKSPYVYKNGGGGGMWIRPSTFSTSDVFFYNLFRRSISFVIFFVLLFYLMSLDGFPRFHQTTVFCVCVE